MAKVTLNFKSKIRMEEEILPIVAKKKTPITLPILSADGYTFTGWYVDTACTIPATLDKMPAEDQTLYAGWEKNAPKVFSRQGQEIVHTLKFNIDVGF